MFFVGYRAHHVDTVPNFIKAVAPRRSTGSEDLLFDMRIGDERGHVVFNFRVRGLIHTPSGVRR